MSRFRPISTDEVVSLAESLDLRLAEDEAKGAVDRIHTLSDIYVALEEASAGSLKRRHEEYDRLEMSANGSSPTNNTYNQWLTRFGLSRPSMDGVLDGVDVAVKDNMCVRGVEMTCGSHAFEGFVPGDHAEVVHRLLDAGATIVGKTNMDELAFGPTSETSAFGPTANPVAPDHVSGGSSSGSAAAVAAGQVDLALGSDTGGSVRIPASYCGIVGIKPTYGLVPDYGVVEMSYSMDHVGTLARTVETAALGLDIVADPGPDSGESAFGSNLGVDPANLTVGVEERFFEQYVSEAVEASVRDAIDELADAGAEIRAVDVPALDYSREAWWGIAPTEFAAMYATNGARLWRTERVEPSLATAIARIRHASSRDLGTNVKEMLLLGQHILETHNAHHYTRARNLRATLAHQFDAALDGVDVIATPSTPTTALEIGGFDRGTTPPVNWDTHPTNLTGHPSVSVPCGDTNGLPIGLQFIGEHYNEATVLDAAYTYEQLD